MAAFIRVIAGGPALECVDELFGPGSLAERFGELTLSARFWRLGLPLTFDPDGRDGRSGPREDLLADLTDELRQHLGVRMPHSDTEIEIVAQALDQIQTNGPPILVLSQPLWLKRVGDRAEKSIDTWLDTWQEIARKVNRARVVTVLPVGMIGAQPGWQLGTPEKAYPSANGLIGRIIRQQCVNAKLFHQLFNCHPLEFAKAPDGSAITLTRIGLVKPVRKEKVDRWLKRYTDSASAFANDIKALFKTEESLRRGVNMANVHEAAHGSKPDCVAYA